MPAQIDLKLNIELWWKVNFPETPFKSLVEFIAGQSHPCFLINSDCVLKIYFEGEHFATASHFQAVLISSGLVPKLLRVFPDDNFLGADAILMEFIQGQDLSKSLITASEIQKFDTGKQIGSILKTVHNTDAKTDQSFDTKELFTIAQDNLKKAQSMAFMPKHIYDLANQFIINYTPKIIIEDRVIVHGDAHPENFIQQKSKLFLIDWDIASMGMRIYETRMLLHMALMPANLVAQELEQYYPEGSLVTLLKGILEVYPEILPAKYLPEIKLIALAEILGHFDLDDSIKNKVTPVKRASYMFEQIFIDDILEFILK